MLCYNSVYGHTFEIRSDYEMVVVLEVDEELLVSHGVRLRVHGLDLREVLVRERLLGHVLHAVLELKERAHLVAIEQELDYGLASLEAFEQARVGRRQRERLAYVRARTGQVAELGMTRQWRLRRWCRRFLLVMF